MDEEVRRFAWGHRLLRHDYETARAFSELYRREGLEEQALLEVVLHIAADYWIISQEDYEIMKSLYPGKPRRTRK
ncbi:hypothetical protein SAMN00808754_0929 [Thermanaeromonas toyohensis ToBE]|uniref:Uncharacterized protein n=2 Tax=Thermanaeromonas TaxID=202949 RepID=A0A1W1VKK5_9FIRM|nr:hypothetical protein SAMN00808754_0929 [Thermanaeromonas toyohensis ToBE]